MNRVPWRSNSGSNEDVELTLLSVETRDDEMAASPPSPLVRRKGGKSAPVAVATAAAANGSANASGAAVQRQQQQGSTLHLGLHGSQVVLKRAAVVLMYVIALVVGLVVLLLYVVIVLPPKSARRRWWGKGKEDEVLTNDWWGLHDEDDAATREKGRPKQVDMRRGVELRTCYITTRDGVKLATDVWIPVKALEEEKALPVVFHQARYYRSATLRWPFNLIVNGGKPISFINDPFFKSFLSHDMILVSVDVRGTGASFGTHPGPWSPEEQQDSLEVLDWIDGQPWSNGRVALWGASYEATSAFFTSLLRHPTVVCCCPMFFFWDVYDDISHPGGVPMRYFSVSWQGFNDCLDSGWVQSTGWMARIFLEGVTPVTPEDSWGYQAKQAILGHKDNWSLLNDAHIRYMDDTSSHTGRMVRSACASHALQRLLADHGRLSPPAPRQHQRPLGGLGGGPEASHPAACPADPSVEAVRRELCAGEGEGNAAAESGPCSRTSARDTRMSVDDREPDGVEDDAEGVQGIGGGGEVDGGGGREERKGKSLELERLLPFYLHVSGWLDASAHAAVMAFTTVPCRGSELLVGPWSHGGHQHVRPQHITTRSKFDFTTEVSGFFVRRLSLPSDAARSVAGDEAAGECARVASDLAGPERLRDASDPGAGTPTAASAAEPLASSWHDPPLPVSGAGASIPPAGGHADGSGGRGEGEGAAPKESAPESASVLAESSASKALWRRARPRVRYFTHQEERWHDTTEFPSTSDHRADVSLFLGGTKQQHRQHRRNHSLPSPAAASPVSPNHPAVRSTPPCKAQLPAAAETKGEGAIKPSATKDASGGGGVDGDSPTSSSEKLKLLSAAEGSGGWASEDHHGAPASTSERQGGGGGGGRMRRKLSTLSMRFRKPQLALSQDAGGREETHELVVDINEDHDGEGISRWAAMTEFWSLISYQMDGLRSNHLRFTSAPLKQDVEVTGYPVVSLWVSAADDLPNLDVFAYLQAVRPRTGLSIYVTEGCFRVEHRKEAERTNPVDVRALPGVPIHSYLRKDAQPLEKGRPVEIRFKLSPTSFKFLKGQRIRLSIGGADSRHFQPITVQPPSHSDQSPTPQASTTTWEPQPGISSPGAAVAGGPAEEEKDPRAAAAATLTKRVLRVHTGGAFSSSGVSLPIPRGSCAGGGREGSGGGDGDAEQESGSQWRFGWGLDVGEGDAIEERGRHAGHASTLTPTTARSMRTLWGRRRTRSLSLPIVEGGTEGASLADVDPTAVRRRSEGRLQDILNVSSAGSGGLFEDDL
eukprot:g1950.t1